MDRGMIRGFVLFSFLFFSAAHASSPKILHQTVDSVIVRMSADSHHVVWQEIGNKKSDKFLYSIELATGKKAELESPKRPFGPSVAGGAVLFGAGRLHEKIEVYLYDIASKKSFRLHKLVPWIVEPALQVRSDAATGALKLQAVWERSQDDSGNGLAIYLWEGNLGEAKSSFKILADGPILRKQEIPREYHRQVHNEYPEIDGDSVVFQNNEYGSPNIYRVSLTGGQPARLAPSSFFQERPAVSGPYTAWEESERGYAESYVSSLFVHDARTGKARKINAEAGFHYQVRLHGSFAIYGAKRQPAPNTPSIRVYDLENGVEYQAQKCFTGSIYDWAPTTAGVYAAQRVGKTSSRILFATWDQLKSDCQ